jgi:hypothetical protein
MLQKIKDMVQEARDKSYEWKQITDELTNLLLHDSTCIYSNFSDEMFGFIFKNVLNNFANFHVEP